MIKSHFFCLVSVVELILKGNPYLVSPFMVIEVKADVILPITISIILPFMLSIMVEAVC